MGECRLGVHGAGLDRTRRRWGNFLRLKDPEDPGSVLSGSQIAANLHTLERPICEPPLACPACFKARELTSSFAQQSRMKRGSGRPHMPQTEAWLTAPGSFCPGASNGRAGRSGIRIDRMPIPVDYGSWPARRRHSGVQDTGLRSRGGGTCAATCSAAG
jgi:hypothetical protein